MRRDSVDELTRAGERHGRTVDPGNKIFKLAPLWLRLPIDWSSGRGTGSGAQAPDSGHWTRRRRSKRPEAPTTLVNWIKEPASASAPGRSLLEACGYGPLPRLVPGPGPNVAPESATDHTT